MESPSGPEDDSCRNISLVATPCRESEVQKPAKSDEIGLTPRSRSAGGTDAGGRRRSAPIRRIYARSPARLRSRRRSRDGAAAQELRGPKIPCRECRPAGREG